MAFASKAHDIDPETGFQVDKSTGHLVGLMPKPHLPVKADAEWPKWIVPHASHIAHTRAGAASDHVSTPAFPDFHVNRVTGEVTVLVHDAEDEARALAALVAPGSAPVAAEPEKPAGDPETSKPNPT